jgi:iron complex outermembrane receptor protein
VGRIEATGRYDFGWLESITLIGAERAYNRLTQGSESIPDANRPVWNLNNPSTWTVGDVYDMSRFTRPGSRLDRTQQFTAAFITQQLAFFKGRVRATAGVRQDGYDVEVRNWATGVNNRFHAKAHPPILSLLVKPIEPVSLYVLSSQSINTNVNQFAADGSPFPPQRGKGIEAGAKFSLWSGRISGSVATFRNERTNVPQRVPGSNPAVFELAGEETVEGTEETLFFFPTDSLQVILVHTYLDGRITKDFNASILGAPLARVSKNSYSAWTKYTFKEGTLKGISLAGGTTYRDAFPTTLSAPAGRTVLPAYRTVDASVGYSRKINDRNWSFSLKVSNLLDEDYRNGNGVPQSLRTYSFTTGVKF